MRTVKEMMSTDCVTATIKDSIDETAAKMKNHDIGIVPVVDGRKLLGVVTDRDLVIRGYAEKLPHSASLEQVLSTDIVTIRPDASSDEAAKLMAKHQIRRLPVVDNGELVGIVAIADLAVRESSENEAGEALSEISEPVK